MTRLNRPYLDVRDHEGVAHFVKGLKEGDWPDLWFLTAGINKPDLLWGRVFEPATFREVMATNFDGVLNFVEAILAYRPKDCPRTNIVCASSTSNIVGNPQTLAYNMSKRALHDLFRRLDYYEQGLGFRQYGQLRFRSLILGPIATNIGPSMATASTLQRRVRDWLTVSVDEAVPVIAKFLEGTRQALYWPRRAVWTMRALRVALKVWPGLYR